MSIETLTLYRGEDKAIVEANDENTIQSFLKIGFSKEKTAAPKATAKKRSTKKAQAD